MQGRWRKSDMDSELHDTGWAQYKAHSYVRHLLRFIAIVSYSEHLHFVLARAILLIPIVCNGPHFHKRYIELT